MAKIFYLCLGCFIVLLFDTFGFSKSIAQDSSSRLLKEYDFNFVASGDWGCGSRATDTVRNMQNKSPNAKTSSGLLFCMFLTVSVALEPHPQSPEATKLKSYSFN